MASELKVNKISPESGTTLTLGDSGDTINFGSGVLPNFENLTVTGDLTVDTNSLKVDSTNNFVGIGTATPSVALDVVGAITATGNITGTLATAAQPNITSLGTLTGLTTTGNINLGDSDKINFGASNDLQIYHDGSHSYISDQGTGNLILQASNSFKVENSGGTETYIFATENGAVELKYDNSTKIATTSTGITVTGTVAATSYTGDGSSLTGITSTTINNNADNRVITGSGTANTLEAESNLVFDGTNLGIGTSSPSSQLHIVGSSTSSQVIVENTDASASAAPDIFLYRNSASPADNDVLGHMEFRGKNSAGEETRYAVHNAKIIDVTDATEDGQLEWQILNNGGFAKILTMNPTEFVVNEDSQDTNFRVESDNSANALFVEGSSGNVGIGTSSPHCLLNVSSGDSGVTPHASADELLIENSSGNSAGLTIASGTSDSGRIAFADTGSSLIGLLAYDHSDNSMQFTTNGSESMRITSAGNVGIGTSSPGYLLQISASDPVLSLYSSGSNRNTHIYMGDSTDVDAGKISYDIAQDKMHFSSNGSHRFSLDSSGHIVPATTNTYDLGSTSLVWRNIYTSDFHMSNEGLDKGNDIDGTKGSWTFQEGENDLFLINNKNGKKYKFNLTEVA